MARLENIGAFYFFLPLFKYKSSSLPKCNPELVTSRHQWVVASLSEGVRAWVLLRKAQRPQASRMGHIQGMA